MRREKLQTRGIPLREEKAAPHPARHRDERRRGERGDLRETSDVSQAPRLGDDPAHVLRPRGRARRAAARRGGGRDGGAGAQRAAVDEHERGGGGDDDDDDDDDALAFAANAADALNAIALAAPECARLRRTLRGGDDAFEFAGTEDARDDGRDVGGFSEKESLCAGCSRAGATTRRRPSDCACCPGWTPPRISARSTPRGTRRSSHATRSCASTGSCTSSRRRGRGRALASRLWRPEKNKSARPHLRRAARLRRSGAAASSSAFRAPGQAGACAPSPRANKADLKPRNRGNTRLCRRSRRAPPSRARARTRARRSAKETLVVGARERVVFFFSRSRSRPSPRMYDEQRRISNGTAPCSNRIRAHTRHATSHVAAALVFVPSRRSSANRSSRRGGGERGRGGDADGGASRGGARRRKKASCFRFSQRFVVTVRRARRRYRSSGGAVGKRRVDRPSRPARAARRERRPRLGPRARRSSRTRDERAEVQSRGRGGPVGRRRGDQRARGVDRARGDAPGLGRALQAQREVLEAHIGGGRGVRARAVGPRDVAGKELRLRRARERVQAVRGGGEQNAAARAVRGAPQATAHTHPGSRRASNVHTGDVMTKGRREGRARDSAGRPLVVVWRSFLNRTGRDRERRIHQKVNQKVVVALTRARAPAFPSPSSRVTSAAAAGRARSARASALDPTPA